MLKKKNKRVIDRISLFIVILIKQMAYYTVADSIDRFFH